MGVDNNNLESSSNQLTQELAQQNKPKQKGYFLPIIGVVLVILLVAAGVFYKQNYSSGKETSDTKNSVNLVSQLNSDQMYEKVTIKVGSNKSSEETFISRPRNTLKSRVFIGNKELLLDFNDKSHTTYDSSKRQKTVINFTNSRIKNTSSYYFKYLDLMKRAQDLKLLSISKDPKTGVMQYIISSNNQQPKSSINLVSQVFADELVEKVVINVDPTSQKITSVQEIPAEGQPIEVKFEDVSINSLPEENIEIPQVSNSNVISYSDVEDSKEVFDIYPAAVSPLDEQSNSYSSNTVKLIFKTDLYKRFWQEYGTVNVLDGEPPQVYVQVNEIMISGQVNLGFNETEGLLGKNEILFFQLPLGLNPGYYDVFIHFMGKNYILGKALLITSPLQIPESDKLSVKSIDNDFPGSVAFGEDGRPNPDSLSVVGTGFNKELEIRIGNYKVDRFDVISPNEMKIFIPLEIKSGYYDLNITSQASGLNQTVTRPSFLLVTGTR